MRMAHLNKEEETQVFKALEKTVRNKIKNKIYSTQKTNQKIILSQLIMRMDRNYN